MEEPPHEFRCAITLEVMDDPAVTEDGHVYERRVIQKWFDSGKRTSPVTNKVLSSTTLRECIPLRNLIADWKIRNKIGTPITPTPNPVPQQQASHEEVLRAAEERKKILSNVRGCSLKTTFYQNLGNQSGPILHVSLVPPKEGQRRPASFICVVDVSGSMDSVTENPTGGEDAFTRINLVVHSLRAFAQTLTDDDDLSLVTFGSTTHILLEHKRMTPANRQAFSNILDRLEGDGCTDMIGGLTNGLKLTRSEKCFDRPTIIMFLTDGDASTLPPCKMTERPFVSLLRRSTIDNPLTAAIHTFGYGYELDSQVLYDISNYGGGVFSFIPDSTMVGTAIVNVMSAAAATVHAKARVWLSSSTQILSVDGYELDPKRKDKTRAEIDVGSIQFGQSRDLVVRLQPTQDGAAPTVFVQGFFEAIAQKTDTVNCIEKFDDPTADPERTIDSLVEIARLNLVNSLRTIIKKINMNTEFGPRKDAPKYVTEVVLKQARAMMDKTYSEIKELFDNSLASGDPRLEAMLSDIKNDESENVGQIGKSLSKADWYIKWGCNYLISLLTALQHQVCHNFKDKSVQNFGAGGLFEKLQDAAQTAFCTLPPPKSTPRQWNHHFDAATNSFIVKSTPSSSFSSYTHAPPTNMASYMNASGGCFEGSGLVLMSDGQRKRVDQIVMGDQIIVEGYRISRIRCVVETLYPLGDDIVLVNGVKVTPFHPVRVRDQDGHLKWQFPVLVKGSKIEPFTGGLVYDFVLDDGHSIDVNGVECITLGHNFKDGVAAHEYFGSKRVVEDLMTLKGWSDGRVLVSKFVRDPSSSLVVGMELSPPHIISACASA
eukprot:TRINITY_DN2151_c0_g1_i1.p1 TRINITY_DN2151_c0_g1~~TRINITY_DN2151_c0_g1_i1.p1  ORF type:complete len:826 (-),score=135.05 TRINITY_DN2151_c0_g1_i1:58-2535(-)